MKKLLFIAFLLTGSFYSVNAQQDKSLRILESISDLLHNLNGKPGSFKDVVSQSIEVNSSSKAYLGGGHTRQALQIHLPNGTEKWYYRVTVMDIKSNYSYQNNESFIYLLHNNLGMENYRPQPYKIDFYVLTHSGEVASFEQTGNNNFIPAMGYTDKNSFIGECSLVQDNLWVGVKNPNSLNGLKVIVEVVAWGHY